MRYLAAGCFRKRTGFQQSDRVKLDTVNLRDGSANPADQIRDHPGEIQLPRVQLGGNGDMLVVCFEREYGDTTGTDSRMLALHRQFKILRVVFHSAYDQKIFQSSGNKQLTVDEHAEITRAQIWSAAIVSEHSAKGLRSFLLATPVTFCNTRRRKPDLTDFTRRATPAGVGIYDKNARPRRRWPTR